MVPNVRNESYFFIACAVFISLFIFSCYQEDRSTGIYAPHGETPPEHAATSMELKENGIGIWRIRNDEASFRWDVRGDEIRLHTKAGGVIVGKIQGNTLELTLQGKNVRYLRQAK